MNKKALNQTIAVCIRVECETNSNNMHLVFEVVDEDFKRRVKEDWLQDIELKIIDGKKLIIDED